jgi:ABC-2 type transport system permease protein
MLEAFLRILALARKELLAILKDPRARPVLFVPPALQCLIFGYVATFDLNHVPYAALDHDRTAASYRLLAAFDGSGIFRRAGNLGRAAEVKTAIDERRALVVVQIDEGFERNLLARAPADVQVIADGRNSNTAGTALGYVNSVVDAFNTQWRADHGQSGPPIRISTRAWYNANLETRWDIVPSLIGTLTLGEMLLLTAMAIAREKEQGTFDQLLVTPFRPPEIMAGKALPSMLVGLAQSTVILLVAQLWFRIPFAGSFVTLFAGVSLFLLATVGVGLFISSLVANMQQALLATFVVVMPFTLLSGLLTPLSSMPVALQDFSYINPLRYMIDIAQRVYLEGVGLDRLGYDLWPLAVIGAVTLTASSLMFRYRVA